MEGQVRRNIHKLYTVHQTVSPVRKIWQWRWW